MPGREVVGDVAFDAGPGTYVVIYNPDPFNDARGIWRVTATVGPPPIASENGPSA